MPSPVFEQYQISGTADHVYVQGAITQSAKLNADGFFKQLLVLPSQRCLDLMRIGVGVHVVDRISKRRKRNDDIEARQLHLVFQVRDVSFWRQPTVTNLLVEILSFLTSDDWSLEFSESHQALGTGGHQDFLALPRPFQPKYAALYSGGLDSVAGLASRLLAGEDEFILITVGHQSGLHARVERQLSGLNSVLEASKGTGAKLLHSTLTTSLEGGKAKRMRQQEQTQRSRAFSFCVAAAIAAKAYDLERIEMFENGVGAINLPLMTGMLGSALSTRGAHPTFLRLMSDLSTQVAGAPIRFELPFQSKTKAEILRDLKGCPGLPEWAQQSRSCVHTALRQEGKTHCGRCPACIERRQAFLCAGIEEDLNIYLTDVLAEELPDDADADYLRLYRLDAARWLERAESVQRRITNHLRLTDIPTEQDQAIHELQRRHSSEIVKTFGSAFPVLPSENVAAGNMP
ncbi:MAG: 7-cyano-7-deazaguanine synthase [Steroidobacteraceae bacterium]